MIKYYVFCPDFIGVETSYENFSWVFGRNAPEVSKDLYDKCLIKLQVVLDKDKKIAGECVNFKDRFGDFYGDYGSNTIIFNKSIKFLGNIAYKISRNKNTLSVVIGKNHLKYVKFKFMHLHPMYYILFDFATALLLENGFMPIYSSAVKLNNGKTVVMIASPNTGKSLTSLKLVKDYNAVLISEDVAVTDGVNIWPIPYTDSYRNYGSSLKKGNCIFSEKSEKINSLFWLLKGESLTKTITEKEFEKVQLLNDYLLYYAKSPTLDAFSFFNDSLKNTELMNMEKQIIMKMFNNINAKFIFENDAIKYADDIANES